MASPVRFAKVKKQLESVGYSLVRINGSHHIFERPGAPIVSIPVHNNKVKPFYVRQVERIVATDKEARAAEQKEATDEGDEHKGQ